MSTRTSDLSINTLMLFHRATDAIAGQEVFNCLYKTDPSYYSSQVIKKYIAKVIRSFRWQLS